MSSKSIEWACPKCEAPANKHGKNECRDRHTRGGDCPGFLCECEDGATSEQADHGTTFANTCSNAVCYHCGWFGHFPVKPRGLAPWEKKALDAGWSPPPDRLREITAASRGK